MINIVQGVRGLEEIFTENNAHRRLHKNVPKTLHTLHSVDDKRLLTSAGSTEVAGACDATMTLMGLVDQVSPWYKWDT